MIDARISVLVVEDEPLVRLGIVSYLEDNDFEVLEAANADEAIELLRTHHEIKVMFTDVDMPGSMDGLKLAAAVRNRWPPVKIVVTSGHRKVGAGDLPESTPFFAKPYDPDMVASVFRQMSGN